MFKERIREHYDDLTPGFRKLADYIMDDTLDVAFLTATELSRRVGVDPATVVRFAQDLGYSGFREMSREIKGYVRDRITASYRVVEEADSTEALLRGLVENARQNIEHFVTTDLPSVVEAVEMLRGAEHIWCTGESAGYALAQFLTTKFVTYGVAATAFEPSMVATAAALARMKEDHVLLTITVNEPCIDAGYAVRLANDKGVRTVTITGSGVVLPARESDVTVIVPHKSPAGVSAFGAVMQVLSLIWEAVMVDRGNAVKERVQSLRTQMSSLLALRAETPEYEVAAPLNMWRENIPQE